MLLRISALITGCTYALYMLHLSSGNWPVSLAGVCLAGAGVIAHRSVAHAVFARGAAVAVLLPAVFAVAAAIAGGRVPALGACLVATAGALACIYLTRPLLETPAAKAAFTPVAHRGTFLAGATVLVATAISPIGLSVYRLSSLVLLACAWGVLRMRSWGVLLGIFIAEAVGLHSAFSHLYVFGAMALVASALLLAPLARARLAPARKRIALIPEIRVAESAEELSACSESFHDSEERAAAG
jgi:hypothetical protein